MSEDKLERNEVQRKMFGYFRESGPPPKGLPKHMYTMEIFHGGYFLEEADGTTKYKIPKFNTNGGKIYLDMLDPEKISWVELNNIAWALGYRELPIAYHFNPPKTPTNMGYVQIKGDGDAVEMVNSIGPKKRQISVYITGGGRRKYAEALVDFEKGVAEGWSNPLNDTRIINSGRCFFEANLYARKFYEGMKKTCILEVAPLKTILEDNITTESEKEDENKEGPSQGTFAGLSDLEVDLIIDKTKMRQQANLRGPSAAEYKDKMMRQKEHIHDNMRERKNNKGLQRVEAELRENQASLGLNMEENEARLREAIEKNAAEDMNMAIRVEAEKSESILVEKRAAEAYTLRQKLAEEIEKRLHDSRKGKQLARSKKSKKSIYGDKFEDARYRTRGKGQKRSHALKEVESEDDLSVWYEDEDYDLENDSFDDDADFDENVEQPNVEEYEEMGYAGYCSEDMANFDGLESLAGSESEEDEQGNIIPKTSKKQSYHPYIRSADIKNPQFRLGLLFPNVEQLRECVREYAIRNQLAVWFEKNTKTKVKVRCQWGCPFNMYASNEKILGEVCMVVKTLTNEHNCSPIECSHFLTYKRIAHEVKDRLMVYGDWSRKGIHKHIEETYKLDVSVQTITRGKRAARRMIEGHYIDQYNKLATYRKELLKRNPGSTVEIMTTMDGDVCRFRRIYICFKACKDGWMTGCRPLIGMDGCHIKGHHPGQLLCAIGIDANNGIFPIAYAVVEGENEETCTWFIDLLRKDVRIERDSSYVFITDKQKGLEKAIKVLLPNAEHRHCVRHLHNNFKQKHRDEIFKQLMWNAARSTTIAWFTKYMDEMKMVKEEAANWFKDKDPSHWSRAYFKEDCKCDTLLNNLCESFNNSILQARDKPILAMLEKIRMDLMVRNANRRVACENWKDVVGPRIKKMLDRIGLGCTNYKVHRAGEYAFQVTCFAENVSQYAVDLGLRTCTCRRWQLSGIPCVHAVSCIRFKKQNASLYCHEYLLCTSYMIAYTPIIHPIVGMDDWEPVDFPIAPPSFNKQPGRPKKKRIPSQGENLAPPAPSGGKLSRVGVTMTCKICGQKGHNRLGCPITKAKKVEQQGQGTSGVGNGAEVTTKKRVKTKVQRIPYPPNKLRPVKEQVIRSRKGYKKMKLAMNGGISSESGNGSASTQPPTQSSQNYAPNVASNFT